MCCIADLQKKISPWVKKNICYKYNAMSMLHNYKHSHSFPLKRSNIFLVAESLSLTCQMLLPQTTKDNFVDYVSYYVLLFSKLQHMLVWGGLRTLVNINEIIWATSSPESKLCLHGLCCIASLNTGKLPLTFSYRCLNNIFFPWQSKRF